MVRELDGFILKIDHLTVSSDSACSVTAVDPRNKNKLLRWRHVLQLVKNHETCAVHLRLVGIMLQISILILFRFSLKIFSLCSILFFLCYSLFYI